MRKPLKTCIFILALLACLLSTRNTFAQAPIDSLYGGYENFVFGKTYYRNRGLAILKDSFWYYDWMAASPLRYAGTCRMKADTLELLDRDRAVWARLTARDSMHNKMLQMIYCRDMHLYGPDSSFANLYQRRETYYPDGKKKTEKRISEVWKKNGILSEYRIYGYDKQGNYTFSVRVREGLNDGKEYVYTMNLEGQGYTTDDNGKMVYTTIYDNREHLCGRWKHGKKTGKWRYYDSEGKLVRTEHYRDGKLIP